MYLKIYVEINMINSFNTIYMFHNNPVILTCDGCLHLNITVFIFIFWCALQHFDKQMRQHFKSFNPPRSPLITFIKKQNFPTQTSNNGLLCLCKVQLFLARNPRVFSLVLELPHGAITTCVLMEQVDGQHQMAGW